MRTLLLALLIFLSFYAMGQTMTYAVIDMHLHVYSEDGRWNAHIPNPRTGQAMIADNPQKHYDATMVEMKKWNYKKAVISGDDTAAEFLWKNKNPDLFITGLAFRANNLPDTNWLRSAFERGKIKVLGEIYVQLDGVAPDSSILEPYYSLAERYDVPVAIHIGPGPQGAPYRGTPNYRMKLSNALELEDRCIGKTSQNAHLRNACRLAIS